MAVCEGAECPAARLVSCDRVLRYEPQSARGSTPMLRAIALCCSPPLLVV
jgi:hypothetical protein